jgi:Uncharacterized MobA-related protein
MSLAILLMAAGRSERFGADDKLLAPLNGVPLVCHAAQLLASFSARYHIAVVGSQLVGNILDQEGFMTLRVEGPRSLSSNLSIGVGAAKQLGATECLVALGDMPFVARADLKRLLMFSRQTAAASICKGVRMPPALFVRSDFNRLSLLEGDQGASSLVRNIPAERLVDIAPMHGFDIDTKHDLRIARHFVSAK